MFPSQASWMAWSSLNMTLSISQVIPSPYIIKDQFVRVFLVRVLFNLVCDLRQRVRELDPVVHIIENISQFFVDPSFLKVREQYELLFLLRRHCRVEPDYALEVLHSIMQVQNLRGKLLEIKLFVGQGLLRLFIKHVGG